MKAGTRRFAELLAYVIVIAMLLGTALFAIHMDGANDILIGGIMTALAIPIQSIGRIGQAEVMGQMANQLAASSPSRRSTDPQPEEVM